MQAYLVLVIKIIAIICSPALYDSYKPNGFLGYYLNSKSISQFDQSRDGSMVDILESLLKFNELKEEEIFNLFYAIQTKYMPKLSDALETGIT